MFIPGCNTRIHFTPCLLGFSYCLSRVFQNHGIIYSSASTPNFPQNSVIIPNSGRGKLVAQVFYNHFALLSVVGLTWYCTGHKLPKNYLKCF